MKKCRNRFSSKYRQHQMTKPTSSMALRVQAGTFSASASSFMPFQLTSKISQMSPEK